MLDICHDHAKDYSISCNASNLKCRRFLHESIKIRAFYVGDNPIKFVGRFVITVNFLIMTIFLKGVMISLVRLTTFFVSLVN